MVVRVGEAARAGINDKKQPLRPCYLDFVNNSGFVLTDVWRFSICLCVLAVFLCWRLFECCLASPGHHEAGGITSAEARGVGVDNVEVSWQRSSSCPACSAFLSRTCGDWVSTWQRLAVFLLGSPGLCLCHGEEAPCSVWISTVFAQTIPHCPQTLFNLGSILLVQSRWLL